MRAGIGYPSSLATGGTWTANGTTWDANYPPANLSNTTFLSQVARSNATGAASAKLSLTSPQSVQFISLANHNLDIAATFRLRLYASSDASGTALVDTGTTLVWPSGSGPVPRPDSIPLYRQTRPILLSSAVTIQSAILDLSSTVVKPEVGAVEMAGWWQLLGVNWGRELGIDARDPNLVLAGGASHSFQDPFGPRQINFDQGATLVGALTAQALDFQKTNDLAVPFAFVHDIDDSTTWARLAMMVTNVQVPPLVGVASKYDTVAFKLNEHMR